MNSINENNLKLGIIGYPLSHTLSPQIHEYWLKLHRISGTYENNLVWRVAELIGIGTRERVQIKKDYLSKI